jgi:hypothetical protein
LRNKLEVTVLYTEGCPHTESAIENINLISNDLNIPIVLKKIQITSQKEAIKHRFIGSPSIQVNGLDIEPAARETQFFGIT